MIRFKPTFDIRNWYWIVAGSTTQVFSSKAKAYVPVTDATYQIWLSRGYRPTRIATEAELWDVLAEQAPECLPTNTAGNDARQRNLMDKLTKEKVGRILFEVAFYFENKIRALHGQQLATKDQVKKALKDLL